MTDTFSLAEICTSLHYDFSVARKTLFDHYFQRYGRNALNNEEVRSICVPMIRVPHSEDGSWDRAQKTCRTSEADSNAPPTSTASEPHSGHLRQEAYIGRQTAYIPPPEQTSASTGPAFRRVPAPSRDPHVRRHRCGTWAIRLPSVHRHSRTFTALVCHAPICPK